MSELTIKSAQEKVDEWINTIGVRYFSELTNLAQLVEEVGELSRIMSRTYGDQSFKDSELKTTPQEQLKDELADVLFVIICIANQTGVDLSDALSKNLEKKTRRDKDRHQQNPKLRSSTEPMNVTVMRKVQFCAGHRLLGHEGKCANLHGHNYVVEFYVSGNEIDELGRVVDFQVINRLFKGWIDENWDHGFLIWDQDTNALEGLRQVQPNRIYEMPYNPTAENMARYLMYEIAPNLMATIKGYDLQCTKVVVWETENSFAEVTQDVGRSRADAMLMNAHRSQFE